MLGIRALDRCGAAWRVQRWDVTGLSALDYSRTLLIQTLVVPKLTFGRFRRGRGSRLRAKHRIAGHRHKLHKVAERMETANLAKTQMSLHFLGRKSRLTAPRPGLERRDLAPAFPIENVTPTAIYTVPVPLPGFTISRAHAVFRFRSRPPANPAMGDSPSDASGGI